MGPRDIKVGRVESTKYTKGSGGQLRAQDNLNIDKPLVTELFKIKGRPISTKDFQNYNLENPKKNTKNDFQAKIRYYTAGTPH